MRVVFRATSRFLEEARADLSRSHTFAAERVGFVSVSAARAGSNLILLAAGYYPVADGDYLDDPRVGALMGQEAIRKALEVALLQPVGMIHVHMHEHLGHPTFSRIDLQEQVKFVPDFFKVRPQMPHGALVLSRDRAAGRVWLAPRTAVTISEFNIVGWRMMVDSTASG